MLRPDWKSVFKEEDIKAWDKVVQTAPPFVYPFQFSTIEKLMQKYYRTEKGSSYNSDRFKVSQKFKMLEKIMDELDYARSLDADRENTQWHQDRDRDEDLGAKLTREEDLREASFKISKRASEVIPGGLADGKPDSDFDKDALAKGINVELEHTSDPKIAKEIAKDHLTEDVEYYEKLETIETHASQISSREISNRWANYEAQTKRSSLSNRVVYANEKIVFTDRYEATGMDYPDPKTVCKGQCEGMGAVPIKHDETDPKWKALWDKAEAKEKSDDGWHFVECPECNGSGKETKASVPNPIRKNYDYDGSNWLDRVKNR